MPHLILLVMFGHLRYFIQMYDNLYHFGHTRHLQGAGIFPRMKLGRGNLHYIITHTLCGMMVLWRLV